MLTISRFILIPVYSVVFFYGYIKVAFLVLLLAGLTDILDGYIARRRGQVTVVGSMLDPLADKAMMIVVILSLLLSHMIPWQAAAAIFARDAGMIAGSAFFHFRGKLTVPANMLGKLTTVLFYIAILLIVFKAPLALPYLWGVIGISMIATLIYIVQFAILNKRD
ncbi:CDP-alcohol phosphatidyltransferase family protein [Paenibacillus athensensis]|uniref:Phosphatidylglycerophosphate synthase n=2 Tax=Paenibacillus athensensis TaxID=1967502 RepID=A0A4Y8Q5N0_9BACL|nr:CDP-alcohol phosphatidyltransferase family protein [Paenibacillus athensensis]